LRLSFLQMEEDMKERQEERKRRIELAEDEAKANREQREYDRRKEDKREEDQRRREEQERVRQERLEQQQLQFQQMFLMMMARTMNVEDKTKYIVVVRLKHITSKDAEGWDGGSVIIRVLLLLWLEKKRQGLRHLELLAKCGGRRRVYYALVTVVGVATLQPQHPHE
jgi:hypothetical protein